MRRVVRAFLMVALVWAGACKADADPVAPPTEANVIGRYDLTIVNGGPLPFPYSATSFSRFDILSGHITLLADHTFTDGLTTRETALPSNVPGDAVVETLNGTWTLAGGTVTLDYVGHPGQPAVVTGKLLTRVDAGLSLTYSK